ncbi:MAG: rhodanese-like domain-containing protein [Polyangiaceae bacterium]
MKIVDPAKAKEYFTDKLAFTTGPVELEGMLKKDDNVQVVDVRTAEDFAKEHIPGSMNLPRERWETLDGLDKRKTNVVVCYSQVCHLASKAAYEFASKGFPVMELEGGFKAWKEHKLPIET